MLEKNALINWMKNKLDFIRSLNEDNIDEKWEKLRLLLTWFPAVAIATAVLFSCGGNHWAIKTLIHGTSTPCPQPIKNLTIINAYAPSVRDIVGVNNEPITLMIAPLWTTFVAPKRSQR